MVDEELLWIWNTSSVSLRLPPVSLRLGHARALTRPRRVIHSPRAASLPTGEGLLLFTLSIMEGDFAQGFCKSKSQRLEPLAGSTGLLALVHTTRLTGGYDF